MRTRVTVTCLALVCLVVGLASTSYAQPVRNGVDVVWARDVAGATMTLDGLLDEDVWDQAETIELTWDGDHPLPGSGQRTDRAQIDWTPLDPPDPINATVRVLRDGNVLWLAVEAEDRSVGGLTNLWNFDGIIMSFLDPSQVPEDVETATNAFANGYAHSEFVASWWNPADTTDTEATYDDGSLVGSGRTIPGDELRLFSGEYGVGFGQGNVERDPEKVAVWDAVASVDGIASDDTHGDDAGYTIEMYLDLGAMGYDFSEEGGDKAAWNIAVNDLDYMWPRDIDPDRSYNSRVWWHNQWTNNFNEGIAYVHGASGVTVNSGAAPEVTEPEFTVPSGELFDAPAIDGSLDDPQWTRITPQFFMSYQISDNLRRQNSALVAKWHHSWFRPDINGDGHAAIVVDPSIAAFKMFFRDDHLYVGVDVNDQAISGTNAETGMDGFYLFLRDRDSTTAGGSAGGGLSTQRFAFSVDSAGDVRYGWRAEELRNEDPTAVEAAVHLKGESTPANAEDVDVGYQIEVAIDLTKALGYPEGRGDGMLWTAFNFLDGDFLPTPEDSYAMRTWMLTERGDPQADGGVGAGIYGYMDPNVVIGTSSEDVAELPQTIRLEGNYPNPFNPSTTLRYALPKSGEISIRIYDTLGRHVGLIEPGMQTAGQQELRFNATHLASGVYFYRVELSDMTGSLIRSTVGQMMLIK